MANYTGKGCFKKGESGNPGGRPKLPAEVEEAFQGKGPEVLVSCLESSDDRITIAAATAILDRGSGRPTQSIDANISEETLRYYAEVPQPYASTEEWIKGNPVKY